MSEPSECCRKDKILDAAEIAFADLGFEGASLRSIVLAADVNLATVYYYFGSKEGLMAAVFKRCFDPLKHEQLERLRQLEGKPLTVESILKAILAPALNLTDIKSAKNQIVTRLVGRIATDPNQQTQELLRDQHREVRQAYLAAFKRVLPNLPSIDLQWRLELIWGSLAFIMCNPGRMDRQTNLEYEKIEMADALPQMIAFYTAGLQAPPTLPVPKI